jgi:hypothetical protein
MLGIGNPSIRVSPYIAGHGLCKKSSLIPGFFHTTFSCVSDQPGRHVSELKLVLHSAAIRDALLQVPYPLQLAPDEGGAILPLVLQDPDGPVEHSPRHSILAPYLTA